MSKETRSGKKHGQVSNEDLLREIMDLKKTISNQEGLLKKMNKKISKISDELKKVKSENCELKQQIEKIHYMTNKNKIIITGLPANEETESDLREIIKTGLNSIANIGNNIGEINRVYKNNKPTKQVLIQLIDQNTKQAVMKNFIAKAKSAQPFTAEIFNGRSSDKIYINNILSLNNQQIMKKATELKYKNKINKVWITKNQVHIKKNHNSAPIIIKNTDDLKQIYNERIENSDDDDNETFNSAEDSD